MPADLAHRRTDKELERLERRIAQVYREARDDMEKAVSDYFASFAKRDEEMKKLVGKEVNGKVWTEENYLQWRLSQIGRGERMDDLAVRLAERMTRANEAATAYVNDATPGVYCLNRNYAAYVIERASGRVGFTLWDEATVRRMLVEDPAVMPYYPPKRAVKRGIDLRYGQRQIKRAVTQGILQGRSVGDIAKDLRARVAEMNRASAVRAARTAITSAQNGGRMDSYLSARRRGIRLKKEWVATLDSRTRHSHRRLDGEVVDYDKPFSNGCRYPGDPRGKPGEVYNCRCTMVAKVEGVDASGARRRDRSGTLPDMTYSQWEKWKRKGDAKR